MIERLRIWARGHSDDGRYSPVGIGFHWIMAFLIIFQIVWGLSLAFWPVGGDKLDAYVVHAAAGMPVLVLALARGVWRLLIPGPQNDADNLGAQTVIAHSFHYIFYAGFLVMPISGWVMWSAMVAPGPLSLAGLTGWPALPLDGLPLIARWDTMSAARVVHVWVAWLLVIIVPLHVIAALKHHFWDRHDVLRGMLPDIPDAEPPQAAPTHIRQAPSARPASGAH
jgi:cytochrome b561